MGNAHKKNYRHPRSCIGIRAIQEKTAIKLLNEYKEKLIAGDNPDPRKYLQRYTGPDKNNFRIELNLVTLLTVDGIIYREEKGKTLTLEEGVRQATSEEQKTTMAQQQA